MIRVELWTKSGSLVTQVSIPPFDRLPEVLVWGERVFHGPMTMSPGGLPAYHEAFWFQIPPTTNPPKETP